MTKNKITAVLGPTNTGKTFLAIETMLSFDTGMMGFPLRLLAREVYDKVIKKVDPRKVALITGEEKIIPANAKYYFCAAEIPRSLAIEELDKLAHDLNLNYQTFPSVETAYLEAKNQAEANDLIYVGGSTFVIAEIL